jgi:hypothetical protein
MELRANSTPSALPRHAHRFARSHLQKIGEAHYLGAPAQAE